MNRSLALLTRKNKEAHQCMDDGSVISYDFSMASATRPRRVKPVEAPVEAAPQTPLPSSNNPPLTPTSARPTLFQAIARKVSSRMNFRDPVEAPELAAVSSAVSRRDEEKDDPDVSHNSRTSATAAEHQPNNLLSHHLDESRHQQSKESRKGGPLSPPSVMGDDEETMKLSTRRSQSVPTAKRRGGKRTLTPSAAQKATATPKSAVSKSPSSLRTRVDRARAEAPATVEVNSDVDHHDASMKQKRSLHTRGQSRSHRERQLSASASRLKNRSSEQDDSHREDDEDDEQNHHPTEPNKTKARRRVAIKVRTTSANETNTESIAEASSNAVNDTLIREALENVRSGKVDKLLQSKLSSLSSPPGKSPRRGSNGAQSCVEPQTTSRDSLLTTPAPTTPKQHTGKHFVKMSMDGVLSPEQSPLASALRHTLTPPKPALDMPERGSASPSQRTADIDAPAGVLHRSLHHSPVGRIEGSQLRRARSKSRSHKDTPRSSSEPKIKDDAKAGLRKHNDHPTRTSSSSRSPRDSHGTEDHKRSPKLDQIKTLALHDDDDGANDDSRSSLQKRRTTSKTPTSNRKVVRSVGSPRLVSSPKASERSENSPKSARSPVRARSVSASASRHAAKGDSSIVDELKKEMSEVHKTHLDRIAKSKHGERSSSHTPRSRPRRALDLSISLPQSTDGKHQSCDESVSESVGNATETPRTTRRKRISARNAGRENSARSSDKTSRTQSGTNISSLGNLSPCSSKLKRIKDPDHPSDGQDQMDDPPVPPSDTGSSGSEIEFDVYPHDSIASSKDDYEMGGYDNDDVIAIKPGNMKARPVVAAQLLLPGMPASNHVDGDEVSVQYEDVVAYNDNSVMF